MKLCCGINRRYVDENFIEELKKLGAEVQTTEYCVRAFWDGNRKVGLSIIELFKTIPGSDIQVL